MGEEEDIYRLKRLLERLLGLYRRAAQDQEFCLLAGRLVPLLLSLLEEKWGREMEEPELLAEVSELMAEISTRIALDRSRTLGLRTNDLIDLKGGLGKKAERHVRVNGEEGDPGPREHLVLRILAEELLKTGPNGGEGYLSAREIADQAYKLIVQEDTARGHLTTEPWWTPTYSDVHKAVDRIRKLLPSMERLIETKPGRGYRLSTAWNNILLTPGGD